VCVKFLCINDAVSGLLGKWAGKQAADQVVVLLLEAIGGQDAEGRGWHDTEPFTRHAGPGALSRVDCVSLRWGSRPTCPRLHD
jgi:hypothetical protein